MVSGQVHGFYLKSLTLTLQYCDTLHELCTLYIYEQKQMEHNVLHILCYTKAETVVIMMF